MSKLEALKARTVRATRVHDDIVNLKAVPINPSRVAMMDGMERKEYLSEELLREVIREGLRVVLSQREKEMDELLGEAPSSPQEGNEKGTL